MKTHLKRWRDAAWKEFLLLFSLGLASVCLWVFVELAEDVSSGEHQGFDERIMKSLRQPDHPELVRGPPWMATAARDMTAMGGAVVTVLVTGLTCVYLALNRRFRLVGFIIVAIGGGFLLNLALKHSFNRPRPDVVPLLAPRETSSSFPSGHSMSSAVVYITMGALLARSSSRRVDKIYLLGAGLLVSAIIALSRVVLGVHYPTDVLAGWSAGTAWALICSLVAYRMQLSGALREPETLEKKDS